MMEDPELVPPADESVDDDSKCEECGAELLWDNHEQMWYCPNTWSHG